jgi:quercetin dioxygenase-like cupin family protein
MTDELRVVQPVVEIDNELTRTVRWTLEPETAIGHHRHLLAYLVIPIVGGTLTFSDAAGDRAVELVPGRPAFRPAGVEHNVSNRSDRTIEFVEVEIRDPHAD